MIWTAFFRSAWRWGCCSPSVAPGLALVPRVLVTTAVMTPIMTYVVLPQLTRRLEWWLQGRPAPWRR